MSQHLAEAELNDYLDGSLPGTERAALEEHLAACALCQAEAGAQRQLLERLHALPRSIDPPAELRSATLRATRRTLPGQGLARWRALRPVALPLAAAALVLVVATALVTRWLVQERPAGRAVVAASPGRARAAPPM